MDAPEITADDPEERKEQLKQAAQEHKQELSAEQQTLKEEIASSHGGDLIKCEVRYAGEKTAQVSTRFEGGLISQLRDLAQRAEDYQEGETAEMSESQALAEIEEIAAELSKLLANVFEADEFDRQLWHEVYEDYGIEPLMTIVENVAEALNEERRKKQGAVDEFRGDK